ncbi:hypothetical protein DSO57_1033792 [Entomophthora muscae]|uniref:Uncharacterized protein n=1 Tax=Entomophthora muscae TaxID=34485 RepID=A0ACC2UL07_9FUNG|nr:hypothetical protein DSO57_1033792 [Entomophthora muscae]
MVMLSGRGPNVQITHQPQVANILQSTKSLVKKAIQVNEPYTEKPGKETLTADALSRLYSKHVLCADGNPNWPMLITGNLQDRFPPGTPMNIQEKVLKNNILLRVWMYKHSGYLQPT